MTDPAFDYRRYAPLVPPKLRPPVHQRPLLVFSQPDIPPRPDELTQQLDRIGNSLVLVRQSSAEVGVILWRRFLSWCATHLWVTGLLTGLGWGGFIAFFAAQYFTR